jgi:hypothetical protein
MSLRDLEFQALRQTIATRGTVRMVLFPATIFAWAVMAGGSLIFPTDLPIAAIFPLAVLVAGFEAVHAFHVGVERVGRYLQVYYENGGDGPTWESTAMRLGPGLPGAGIDPLFTVVFCAAALANMTGLMAVENPSELLADLVTVVVLHALFVVRIVRARVAAARQRAVDLETFRAIRTTQHPPLKPYASEGEPHAPSPFGSGATR